MGCMSIVYIVFCVVYMLIDLYIIELIYDILVYGK